MTKVLRAAVGITSEATANQNPRPGVAFRTLRDAPPIPVSIVWWKDEPPGHLTDLLDLACAAFRTAGRTRYDRPLTGAETE